MDPSVLPSLNSSELAVFVLVPKVARNFSGVGLIEFPTEWTTNQGQSCHADSVYRLPRGQDKAGAPSIFSLTNDDNGGRPVDQLYISDGYIDANNAYAVYCTTGGR